ncbi:MAG TPA: phenylalanine--tRNA ligase subunit beta, partial [Streptosporangiaceae bacterium]
LAGAGYVEVLSSPFGSAEDFGRLQLPEGDPRRRAVLLANPIRDEEPQLRTTLLPGLLRVAGRNAGRGFADLSLFEIGNVARLKPSGGNGSGNGRPKSRVAPILAVDRGPTPEELATLEDALPDQPRLIATVLAGKREPAGWWGGGREASFRDAIEAAHEVLRASRVPYEARPAAAQPWHPGRCAEFVLLQPGNGDQPVTAGYAGELHPRVVQAFRLAPRTCAAELDLTVIERAAAGLAPVQAPVLSAYPVASQDVALVVGDEVRAADVAAALAEGAAEAGGQNLLEEVRLFDVYAGEQVGAGRKSLAYTLRFRAPDRTLTDEDVAVAREAAVAAAQRRTGAVLRGA